MRNLLTNYPREMLVHELEKMLPRVEMLNETEAAYWDALQAAINTIDAAPRVELHAARILEPRWVAWPWGNGEWPKRDDVRPLTPAQAAWLEQDERRRLNERLDAIHERYLFEVQWAQYGRARMIEIERTRIAAQARAMEYREHEYIRAQPLRLLRAWHAKQCEGGKPRAVPARYTPVLTHNADTLEPITLDALIERANFQDEELLT